MVAATPIAVPAMPELRGLRWARSAERAFPFDAGSPERVFTAGGRTAIFQGLTRLGIGEGEVILVPAYCCGSEVDAVLQTGAVARYYRLTADLVPDLDHCRALVAGGARAMLVTHYLGFPQPIAAIAAFARAHDLWLIEDCAHALLASADGCPVGRTGDLAVFSFVKTLPLPDGGAAVFNRRPTTSAPRLRSPSLRKVAGRAAFLAEMGLGRTRPALARTVADARAVVHRLRAAKPAAAAGPLDREAQMRVLELAPSHRRLAMSGLSRWLVGRLPLAEMSARRRRNYVGLRERLDGLRGVRPLFDDLPEGAVPMGFALKVADVAGLQRRLAARGIGTKAFWTYFHRTFPDAAFPAEAKLKRSVLLLPVHQDIDAADLDRIAEALRAEREP